MITKWLPIFLIIGQFMALVLSFYDFLLEIVWIILSFWEF